MIIRWRSLTYSEDGMYLQTALDFFNTIFGSSEDSEQFWNKEMKESLLTKFTLENGEIASDFDPSIHAKLFPLFLRLQVKRSTLHLT